MIRLLRPLTACALALALAACAKTAPAPGGLGDVCVDNRDCASGFTCATGKCVLPANLGGCEAGRKRCNGADVEQCDAGGLGWTLVSSCATGCSAGACRPQACTPGARRCEGDAAEACAPAGDAWALVQVCPSHCDAAIGSCKAPVCTPFATRCDGASNAVQTCDSFGAAWSGTACAAGTVCDGGRCQGAICAPGAARCSGSGTAVETCNALGDAWVATTSCQFGCAGGAGSASCAVAACAPGDTRCNGSAVEQCKPDQTGFAFVNFCATGCTQPPGTAASCAAPICAPSARRCAADGVGVEVCSANGTGWTRVDTCPVSCAGGQCTSTSANCQPGDLRCNGPDAQACSTVAAGITQWKTTATCLSGCSSGACAAGGSCVSLKLNAAAGSVPIDGLAADPTKASTVLVYSDVVVAADGSTIPDGTEFTVQVSPPATIASANADASLPGTQVKSFGGRVRFTVRAPVALSTGAFNATATATLTRGPSCTGSTTAGFAVPPPADQQQTMLFAEDFTTARLRNVTATTADWSTGRGALVADWPSSVGDGRDGQLCVSPAPDASCPTQSPFNLTAGYAASFAVLGLTAQSATVDRPAQQLSGGDEVILWDAQGSSSGFANAGGYELLHVASADGSVVNFVEPVRGTYGAVGDQNVATQRVVLQRVPHFTALQVKPGATLSADGWDGTRGGLLAVRVRGAAVINGDVSMDALGFRGGNATTAHFFGEDQTGAVSLAFNQQTAGAGAGYFAAGGGYGTSSPQVQTWCGSGGGCYQVGLSYGLPLLGKLFLGAGGGGGSNSAGGGRGGGAIVISAQSITLANGSNASIGRIHADGAASNSGGGAGGSVWLAAPSVVLGTTGPFATSITARGGTRAGDGRIRIDLQQGEAALPCARLSAVTCNSGFTAPLQAQSLDAAISSRVITQATLLLALDAPASAVFQAATAPSDEPGQFGTLGAPGCAPNAVCFLPGAMPLNGPRFRWKVLLSPQPDAEQSISALQWSLKVP